ncbi:MAG: S8 family serine peptidase [Acidimicrobiales bacterium]|nr:S8 family serine peptidase [Acidimicrobiales bacterium]
MNDEHPDRPAWSRESAAVRLPSEAASLADDAWLTSGADGTGVRVAIIDSGIDADHPDLHGRIDTAAGVAFTVDSDGAVQRDDGPHDDAFGHGTACAGIVHLLAPGARITSIKVLGAGLRGRVAAFHAGFRHAVEAGYDVINLSLGTRKADWALAFHELCDDAYFANSVVVTAANNLAQHSHPSLYASVVSVASNLATDPRRYHANPQPPTEFCARGIGVPVLWSGHGHGVVTGNSYAAAHIAGLAALVRSHRRHLRPFHVKAALWAGAANVRDAGGAAGPPEVAGRLTRTLALTRGLSRPGSGDPG